jgi:hypothetical protein
MLGFIAYTDLPDSWYKIVALPAALSFLGVYLWLWGRTAELKHGAGPWKWFAAFPLVVALSVGWGFFGKLTGDFLYRDAIEMFGPRIEICHYVAFFLPLFCIVGLPTYEFLDRRAARLEAER